jgi:predicted metal-dependent hydrolase
MEEAKEKTLNLERTDSELRSLVILIVNNYKSKFDTNVNQIFFRRIKTKWAS